MSIEAELRDLLKEAMKSKDQRTLAVVRMITSRMQERRTAKGFSGEVDDALYQEVIAAYRKTLLKGREEFLAAGERGKEQAEQLQWEADFCQRFLPKGLSPEEIEAAVQAAIATLGTSDPKMAGRVVGLVMKDHKGLVEAAEVKAVAERLLG